MERKLCLCGCGGSFKKFDKNGKELKYLHGHNNKGRKMSQLLKNKIILANTGRKKTLEEIEKHRQKMKGRIFGPKSEEVKRKIRLKHIGKKHSEETKQKLRLINLGKKLSDEHKYKMSISHKGKKFTKEHIENCQKKRAIPTELIVRKTLEELAKEPFLKTEISKRVGYGPGIFIRRWGSLNEFARKYNIEFKRPNGRWCPGNVEKLALEEYRKQNPNNDIIPQYTVFLPNKKRYFVDWYDKTTNTIYEFDEPYHKQIKIFDIIRDNNIKNKLNCNIKRIDMISWLNNKKNF